MSALLEARGLGRILPGDPPVTLVRDASLVIEPGSFTTIVGPSGCGKSSLLYLLSLIDRPTSGELLLEGQEVSMLSGDERAHIRLQRFGFVFQFHFLLPEFTALENVLMPIQRLGVLDECAARARAMHLLDSVGLAEKHGKTPDRLSGGERQRVAIARALVSKPDVLVCDEVTSALDVLVQAAIVDLLGELRKSLGLAMLFVTHNLPLVRSIADEVAVMSQGRIVELGSAESVIGSPHEDYTRRLITATPSIARSMA